MGIVWFYDTMDQKEMFEEAQVLSLRSLQLTLGTNGRMSWLVR